MTRCAAGSESTRMSSGNVIVDVTRLVLALGRRADDQACAECGGHAIVLGHVCDYHLAAQIGPRPAEMLEGTVSVR